MVRAARPPSTCASSTAKTRTGCRRRSRSAADAHDVWSATTRVARARHATTRSGRTGRPGRGTPSTRAAPARPVRPRARPHAPTASGAATCRTAVRLGRRRQAAHPARPHRRLRGAREGPQQLNPDVPEELRGTYAGLAHESTIALPEGPRRHDGRAAAGAPARQRAAPAARWASPTTGATTPSTSSPRTPAYASRAAQFGGTGAVLREFKGMVRLLHEAGIEVILDVVYNHTAEEGRGGPTSSPRARQRELLPARADGRYIDVTGCGNTLDSRRPPRSGSCSTRCATGRTRCRSTASGSTSPPRSGRDADAEFDPEHPLLTAIVTDPRSRASR